MQMKVLTVNHHEVIQWVLASGLERIMQCWINGRATDGIDDKIKMAKIHLEL